MCFDDVQCDSYVVDITMKVKRFEFRPIEAINVEKLLLSI